MIPLLGFTEVYPEHAIMVANCPSPDTKPVAIHPLPAKVRAHLGKVLDCVPFNLPIDSIFGSQIDHARRVLKCRGDCAVIATHVKNIKVTVVGWEYGVTVLRVYQLSPSYPVPQIMCSRCTNDININIQMNNQP